MYNKQMKALFALMGAMLLTGCAGKMIADSIETVSETSVVETSVEESLGFKHEKQDVLG